MRTTWSAAARHGVSSTLGCLVLAGVTYAGDDFPIHVYPCPLAESAPVIDGKLDDAAWQKAPLVSGFVHHDKPAPIDVQTSFRVLYDANNLYFGVRCEEPQMDKVSPVAHARDEHAIFHGETLEFFIDPHHTHERYYQLGINAAASLYDSERTEPVWNSAAKVRTHLDKDFWSMELALPWKDLGVTPKPGHVVGFNLCRDRYAGRDREWSTWSQVKANFHDPERFSHLVLSATPEMMGKMGQEFRRAGRTGPILVFSAEGFAEKTYSGLASQALADLDRLIADLEAERKKESDAAAAAELGKRLDEYRKEAAALRAEPQGKLDAASWSKLDRGIQKLTATLKQSVWEARLSALLSAI